MQRYLKSEAALIIRCELLEREQRKDMKVGDRVRVKESITVYHHPEHRNQPFDIEGQEGEIVGIVHEWQGKPVSPNFPVQVKFSPKFKAHLREAELELIG